MKRLIIVLIALTAVLQTKAANILSLDDISPNKTYYIRTINGGYLYADTDKAKYDGLSTPTADNAHQWAVAKSKTTGQVFIYNLQADAFLSAADGVCPLIADAVMIQLLPSGQKGSWIGFTEGRIIALSRIGESSQISFLGESGNSPDFLMFEEAGTLSLEAEKNITAKAQAYDTNRTAVPMITSIGTAITSLAQLTDGLTFLFYSTGKDRYAYDAGESLSFNTNSPALNNITVMPYVFVAHKVGSEWTFSTMEGKYISGFSGGVSTGETGITFTVTESATSGSFNLYNATASQYLNATNERPVGWGDSEGNSRYQIIPVTLTNSDSYFPITYLCYETDGENTRLMDRQTYARTTNRLSPPTFTGFKRTSLVQPNGERFASTLVTGPTVAVCTYKRELRHSPVIPTTITDGAFSDTTRWYRIRVEDKYMQWTANASGHYELTKSSLPTMDDSDLWCFVGNNVNGYRIYNRAAGTALSLAFKTEPIKSAVPFLCDGEYNKWVITNGGSKSWYVSPAGTKNITYLCNDGQGKLSVYAGETNIFIDEAATEMQTFAEEAAANLGSRVGQYNGAEADALIAAAENYTLNNEAFNALQNAHNNFVRNAPRVELREDMLYRIVNKNTTDASLKADIDATTVSHNELNESLRTQLWRMLPIGNTGAYYLLNPENGRFMGQTNSSTTIVPLVEKPTTHTYEITNVLNTIAEWRLRDMGASASNYVAINNNKNVVGTTASSETGKWFIEPAYTFTVTTEASNGGNAATTLFLPFSVELPDGITAMAVTAKDDGGVEFTSFESNVVPANTPCVLISSTSGSYTLTETTTQSSAPEGNLLTGVAVRSSNESEGLYTLDANANLIAAPATLPAYSAVLAYDNTTSINALGTNKAGESIWYDLSGRRLHKAPTTNGVYIQNGKKVLVR